MSVAEGKAAKAAIAGGQPAKSTPFNRGKRYGDEELAQLKEALDQGTLFYAQGKKVRQLEEAFAQKLGVRFAVACSSGTAAIHTAMMAAGISPGDEVIVPPITDMGSIVPILFQGAVPVFADLEPYSYELKPDAVRAALTPRTRAILSVHLWGNACDLDELARIASQYKLSLIEDCAQAFGCEYRNKPIGTLGDLGCFSYNEFKHISCGDGGLVVTNDEKLAKRARLSTDKCYDRDPNATMRNPTFLANNYRMTELQGAVAIAQLAKLDSIVARRRSWCERLSVALKGMPGISLPQPTPGCNPSWWFYLLRVKPEELKADADQFCEAMKAEGVPMGAHYIGRPVYDYPIFTDRSPFQRGSHAICEEGVRGKCPEAEAILQTGVMLPINEGFTDSDLAETIEAFRKVTAHFCGK